MLAAKRYLAVSIDLTVSSSSIFRAVSREGAQKMFGLETWRVMFSSLHFKAVLAIYNRLCVKCKGYSGVLRKSCDSRCRLLKLKGVYEHAITRRTRSASMDPKGSGPR